ncbi:hypothetical protein Dsin_001149 [Dipteronia sinensis]|uniref:Transposase n=1 Tax=Dipteronia sinensis TaxID=43782 RepID=A0AAE0EI37_9ROSI|nr:hypothetical protein Dsin_001149 [Dipteronia sinensis]
MANDLTWHSTHTSKDGKMRHPVDSPAWETIDNTWPCFTLDPCNLRLGLAVDGFNPFRNLSSTHSTWPVVLVTYNLPLWKCMSNDNLMLTLLIPGPKQPGNDIDVYLQPLIEDLNELWHTGVEVYDVASNSTFNLKAILMWTVNDFPTYGNLAGCCVKGRYACPACGLKTCFERLKFSNKNVCLGHRRFLPMNHTLRKKNSWFKGVEENGDKPRIIFGKEVRLACDEVENDFGKKRTWDKKEKSES